jgi:predicted phosphodiesterase
MSETKKPTHWTSIQKEEAEKAHRNEVGALRNELRLAKLTMERMKEARKPRIPVIRKAAKRASKDIIRVVVPDTHGALVNHDALAAMLSDIKTLDPHEIVLLGDHVDCGGFLAQHHVMGYVAETDYTYEEDLAAANAFLDALQKAAPRAKIEYIEGNHERRVETWCVTQTLRNRKDAEGLRLLLSPEFRLYLKDRAITYYRQGEFYDDLPVPGVIKRGKCFFFHGISTSKGATASTIERISANCVFGHTHRAQSTVVRRVSSGIIGSWNPGCLCSLQPLWQNTNPTDWSHGYAVQICSPDGRFLHLNIPIIDGTTNFASLLKL